MRRDVSEQISSFAVSKPIITGIEHAQMVASGLSMFSFDPANLTPHTEIPAMPIIMLVDDSEVDRKLMAGLLSADVDWLVSEAKNGVEALEILTYTLPDVVVTDLMMPEMDGMELVSRLAESFPNVPVVLVTGVEDSKLAMEALRKGAASFVPKQQLTERLLDTVEQVLALRDADH